MKWFLDLTTRSKLILGFGAMFLLLMVVAIAAYANIQMILESQKSLYRQDFIRALSLMTISNNINRVRAAILSMIEANYRTDLDRLHSDIKDRTREDDRLIEGLREIARDDPEFSRRLEELVEIRNAFVRTQDAELIPLIYQGKTNEAKALALGVQNEKYIKIRSIGDELGRETVERAERRIAESEQKANKASRILMMISMAALALGVVMISLLNRIIANPLKEMSGVAAQMASGDLSVSLSSNNRADEVGVLTQTFIRMMQSLKEKAEAAERIAAGDLSVKVKLLSDKDIVGGAFATMVDNLRHITAEITEGVNVLASSASEILAATTQLASGAAETATAISQTTTTTEEVKQTAQVSSQKARYVSESAQKASQVAQGGRKAVEELIEGMNRIKKQMESIAETIVRLSDQSQAIGEIIATVNDLSDQSNLLAVNAAIEAAKAGEQGRGFAVVAQEIKSLADQSKQATTQVRTILNDIQKAIGAAVLAAEQGSKAVEAGLRQSVQAGESIRMLADSIAEAAQAATQIAASSQQQLVGMDQVASAMDSIKQASAQNVAGAKQAEAAAQNMHELGQRLKHLVERFKL